MNVVILDTGCANLNSVKSAIARHGYEPKVSRDPDVVLLADKLDRKSTRLNSSH